MSEVKVNQCEVDALEAIIQKSNGAFPWKITDVILSDPKLPIFIMKHSITPALEVIGQANGSDVTRVYGVRLCGDGSLQALLWLQKLAGDGVI